MRLQKRSYSKVSLGDLLRRKKKSLKQFLDEVGIVTYELLITRCQAMGVNPPSEEDFKNAMGNPLLPETSSPTEGVVVLSPPAEIPTLQSPEEKNASSEVQEIPKKKKKSSSL